MATTYIDYAGRDYTARYEAMLAATRADLPEWTDENHSDAGIALYRREATETDLLNLYIDQLFTESWIGTARFKQSLINIASALDYPPLLASAAMTTLQITPLHNDTKSIPAQTIFTRADSKPYFTTASVTISNGATVLVPATQGTLVTYTLTPSNFAAIDKSGNLKYNLGANIAAGSVSIYEEDSQVYWQEVDSFWQSGPSDKVFKLELYANKYNGVTDTVNLCLGNGTYGRNVFTGNLILVFNCCDGANGNCGSNQITVPPPSLVNEITVTNTINASGGALAEATEPYRSRLPLVTRIQRRAVTLADYIALMLSLPGIDDCQSVDRSMGPVWPFNFVTIYLIPAGRGFLTPQLTAAVYSELTTYGHLGGWSGRYMVHDAIRSVVPIVGQFGIEDGYTADAVMANINLAIQVYFLTLNIGDGVDFGDLNLAAGKAIGASWINFTSPVQDILGITGTIYVPGTPSLSLMQ